MVGSTADSPSLDRLLQQTLKAAEELFGGEMAQQHIPRARQQRVLHEDDAPQLARLVLHLVDVEISPAFLVLALVS